MGMYQTKLIDKKSINEMTRVFSVEKPTDFEFKAGQFVKVILPKIPDDNNWRWLSIASAPYEKDLLFCHRSGNSNYKKFLETCETGHPVEITKPQGKFVLPENTSVPIAFIVGGVGIAPVRAMIWQAIHDKSPQKFYLFYSNSYYRGIAFHDEFSQLANKNLLYIPTLSQATEIPSNWPGESGRIDMPMLKNNLPNTKEVKYFVVGGTNFVRAMVDMLKKEEIELKNIVIENFTGL